jgi:2-amino-4-hydroxy-6-hydroxymethyldihydropteridine diphosphokinase
LAILAVSQNSRFGAMAKKWTPAMATCLVALGSNAGNREATLADALTEMETVGPVRRHSRLYRSRPVGGPPGQGEFLNAAAVVETELGPSSLLQHLQQIETRHARQRSVRWAARTLDLDLLLCDERVIESAELTVPHPRMSFRRFVLEPAAEIAGQMLHPTIGWTIQRLLDHLNTSADHVAILSPAEDHRRRLATVLADRFAARSIAPPAAEAIRRLWPAELTTWLALDLGAGGRSAKRPVTGRPKLTIILDAVPSETRSDWPALRLPHDRGPMLALRTVHPEKIGQEACAAVQAAWPELCPPGTNA